MQYQHMSGAGNDFVVMDIRGQSPDLSQLARQLCQLEGADGLLAVDRSEYADFKLHYYNSDGTRADLCGNGSRCVCRYAYDQGIAGREMQVETDAGTVYGWRVTENEYRVKLTPPRLVELEKKPGVDYVVCGVPHALQELPGLTWGQKESLRQQAVALRHDPAFPEGANVDFYTWLGDGEVRVLTFERGVEDYTLACGTGCAALAAALYTAGKLPEGGLTAHNPGGTLTVTVTAHGGPVTEVYLQGPTEYI